MLTDNSRWVTLSSSKLTSEIDRLNVQAERAYYQNDYEKQDQCQISIDLMEAELTQRMHENQADEFGPSVS